MKRNVFKLTGNAFCAAGRKVRGNRASEPGKPCRTAGHVPLLSYILRMSTLKTPVDRASDAAAAATIQTP